MSTDAALRPQPAPAAPSPAEPSAEPRTRRTTAGRPPARPTPAAAFHSVSAATAVLLGLVEIGAVIHEPVLCVYRQLGGCVRLAVHRQRRAELIAAGLLDVIAGSVPG